MAEDIRVPTQEEIAQLPLGAQVAFAARCVRRVQPLFTFFWPNAPQKHTEAVEKAISIAGRFAAGDKSATNVARDVARILVTATGANRTTTGNADNIATIADAAAAAVTAAAEATRADTSDRVTYFAARAAEHAATVVKKGDFRFASWEGFILQEIRRDFDKLLKATKQEKWEDKHSALCL